MVTFKQSFANHYTNNNDKKRPNIYVIGNLVYKDGDVISTKYASKYFILDTTSNPYLFNYFII